jgi:hypothetical protein
MTAALWLHTSLGRLTIEGQRGAERSPTAGLGSHFENTLQLAHALGNADQSKAAPCLGRTYVKSASVIGNHKGDGAFIGGELYIGAAGL